jgi:glycosyltransferase involved in cell wall biosynthesis
MTDGADLVSVIIPVYNGAAFLAEALASVAAQHYPAVETIVVDDGSTDGSGDVAAATPPVRCIRQERQGPAAARNAGVASSSGTFLAFLDADDLMPAHKLTTQVGYLQLHPDVDCVLGRQDLRAEPGVTVPAWATAADASTLVAPMSMVVRRPLFDAVGPFDEGLGRGGANGDEDAFDASDTDWQLRLRELGVPVVVLDDVVVIRRLHGANMSSDTAMRRATFEALRARVRRRRAR